jgi:Peptidase family M1 domain/Secretion system C-terminal sorting domain/Peptidase M1 N-terminal domain
MNNKMKKSKILIPLIFFAFLFISFHQLNAQFVLDTNTEKFAEREKQSFKDLSAPGTNGAQAYVVTTASNNFDISFYRCEWEIDPNIRFIRGKVTSYFSITSPTDKIVFDLSAVLTVDSITYRGNQLTFQKIANDGLEIQFPSVLNAGQKDSVSIYYNGVPRLIGGFQAFVQSTHSGTPVIWTLSEPYGAKEWWPCKNGVDDKADSIDVIITNPDIYQASSNGIMVQESFINSTKISVWKHRYPIASYLVALSVTNFVVLKDTMMVGGKIMDLIDYAYPETKDVFNIQRIFTKYALNLYAKLFEDYPFAKEKYGYTQFGAGGGMEHQTNTFLNLPTIQLIEHETGHQWFGDKITCGSWQDIWLNEGFATYCQVLFNQNIDTTNYFPILTNISNNITSSPGGSVWVDDTTSVNRIFSTRLTYYKGAYLLHMLRWKLGDSVFFHGMRRYLKDPLLKYNYARTADLQRNMEQESGKDLSTFFQKWFYQQGYPTYSAEWVQDTNNLVFVRINQATSHPSVSFYDMPVPVEFKNSSRDTIIVFDHIKNGQAFLANPGFKADTAIFDPLLWILCRKSTNHTVCNTVNNNDSIFPNYKIQWFQNSNNWSYVDINQANTLATALAENIPLYLHFSGNGRDTAFLIKNIRYHYSNWMNIGFKATNVFVTTSCFMDMNYSITNQTNSTGINDIKIFPVPVINNTLNISLKNPSDKQLVITVFNAAGQLVYQKKYDTPGKDELFAIPFNSTAKGIYIIRLESESKIKMSRKIIK